MILTLKLKYTRFGQVLTAAVATARGRNDLQRLAQRTFGGTHFARQRGRIPFIFVGGDEDRGGVDCVALGRDNCASRQRLIASRLGKEGRSYAAHVTKQKRKHNQNMYKPNHTETP
jgi:hypothetical protein